MFEGYMNFGGIEVINEARTRAYAENGLVSPGTIIECGECDTLAETLGDDPYRSPALDTAPWFDADEPFAGDFAGLLPLGFTGLDGSTRVAEVLDRIGDGGLPVRGRAKPRVIGATAMLVGRSHGGIMAGLAWLSSILHPPCVDSGECGGSTLSLFTTCPEACDGSTDPDEAMAQTAIAPDDLGVEGGTVAAVAAATRTNLLPRPSFELGATTATGWTETSGGTNGTITREVVAYSVTSQAKAQRIVCDAQANQIADYAGQNIEVNVSANTDHYARVDVDCLAMPAGHTATLQVEELNVANAVIATHTDSTGTSGELAVSFTTLGTCTHVRFTIVQSGTGVGGGTGYVETVWDSAMLVEGAPVPYFDGATTDSAVYTYAWTGTANASTSTMTAVDDFAEFTSDGSGLGRLLTTTAPGVCDRVEATWTVTNIDAADVEVSAQLLDSTGTVTEQTDPVTIAPDETVTITVVSDPSPGWEASETWSSALTTDGDVLVAVYLSARPVLSIADCTDPLIRTYRNVVTVAGPTVVEEIADFDGEASLVKVEWTWVAADPYAYAVDEALLTGVPSGGGAAAAVGYGVTLGAGVDTLTAAATACPYPSPPALGCNDNPNGIGITNPPAAPTIADTSMPTVTNWHRRTAQITNPAGVAGLSFTIVNDDKPKLGIRIRVWRDTDPDYGGVVECEFAYEFTIDYLAADQTLYFDTADGTVLVTCTGETDLFDHIRNVRGAYGGPFAFPLIGCGDWTHIAVDIPVTYTSTGTGYTSGEDQGEVTWSAHMNRRAG